MVGSQPAIAKEGDAPVTASALGEANLVHTMKTHQSTNPFALPLPARSARAGPASRSMHSALRLSATDRGVAPTASLRWPASLCCTLVAFPGPEASTWR